MSGIDLTQLKIAVVQPVLALFGPPLNSRAAEVALLGIAEKETEGGHYLYQLDGGPALSPWQMEPATYYDCWANFLKYKPALAQAVHEVQLTGAISGPIQMRGNLYFACAMARIKLYRVMQALPQADDAAGMAQYWKTWYNTAGGAGVVDQATVACWQRAAAA